MEREVLLLGLLRQSDMHGYKIIEFIERDLAMCTDLKKPTAYFLLEKMAQNGWISWTEDREGHRPLRRIYTLTPQGEAQFQKMLRESLAKYHPIKFADDIALAFSDNMPPEEMIPLLAQRREALASILFATRQTPHHKGAVQLVIDHQLVHLESELKWLDGLLEQINLNLTIGEQHGLS